MGQSFDSNGGAYCYDTVYHTLLGHGASHTFDNDMIKNTRCITHPNHGLLHTN
jgi:hypothetical protein